MCRSKHAYIRQVVPASHGAIGSTSRSPHLALALLSTPLCSLQKPTLMMLASQVESLWLPWACCSTICRLSALYNVGLNVLLSIMVSDFVKFITETYTYDASFSGRANFTSTTSAAPHFFLVCFVQSGPECAFVKYGSEFVKFLTETYTYDACFSGRINVTSTNLQVHISCLSALFNVGPNVLL